MYKEGNAQMDYKDRDIYKRSVSFAIEVSGLVDRLPNKISTRTVSNQLMRSATSISANIAEGSAGVSKRDFVNFIAIAKKSAIETEHWLNFLKEMGLSEDDKLLQECVEIIKILTSIVNNTKTNNP